jgi:hypothetical protein
VKYLPLFYHFKAIYQFPKHILVLVKIVANASLSYCLTDVVNEAGFTAPIFPGWWCHLT